MSFVAPETVVAAIKRRFNDAPSLVATVSAALAVPLARNGNLACSSNGSAAGCDYIDTDRAAIIYDENNARINLFWTRNFCLSRRQRTHGISPRTAPKMR